MYNNSDKELKRVIRGVANSKTNENYGLAKLKIIDLAVESGGNCPLSEIDKVVVHNGVKIIGYSNIPGKVSKDASSLYARNIFNFIELIIDKKEDKINIDWEDEIIKSVVVTKEGQIIQEKFK